MTIETNTERPVDRAELTGETILTGDRPTGALHLGHLAGSLSERVRLQDANRQFVMVADMQALTDNAGNPAKVADAVHEVVRDYVAAGIDPRKTTVFLQSDVPELAELTMLYQNVVTVSRLERNPTVRDEIRKRDFGRDIPAGFLCYPVSQAADITAFGATLVPVGEDQLPIIEIAVEIAARINRMAGSTVLVRPRAHLSRVPRLPGIDGKAKASKSLGNAVMIGDDARTVARKVQEMFTDPNHLRVEDAGKVEGNVVFSYLDAFDPDRDGYEDMCRRYRAGGLGDGVCKARLRSVLDELLTPMRDRRAEAIDVEGILDEGRRTVRGIARERLAGVRNVFGLPDRREA